MKPIFIQMLDSSTIEVIMIKKMLMMELALSVTDLFIPVFCRIYFSIFEIFENTSLMWMNLTNLNQ